MKVAFTAEANADPRGIARHNKLRAQSFVRELREKAKDLGEIPNASRSCHDMSAKAFVAVL